MNILVIGKSCDEAFARHIGETVALMGHNVRQFEVGLTPSRIGGRFGHRLDQVRGVLYTTTDSLPAVRALGCKSPVDLEAKLN